MYSKLCCIFIIFFYSLWLIQFLLLFQILHLQSIIKWSFSNFLGRCYVFIKVLLYENVFFYSYFFISLVRGHIKFLLRNKKLTYEALKKFLSITHKIAGFWLIYRFCCFNLISILNIFNRIQESYHSFVHVNMFSSGRNSISSVLS